jgi:hypothetical protein
MFPETHQSHGWRGLDMFHGNKTLCSTGLADMEHRGQHSLPRMNVDRT